MLAQEIIRRKRNCQPLEQSHIAAFVSGLVDHSWSDAQVGSMAMAIFLNGLTREETVNLTLAMKTSGDVLDWSEAGFDGPILDKHSSGGVGDKVSLPLAAIIAACGGFVPMISGRGLGHTGGTLDKLEAIPGYQTTVSQDKILKTLKLAGCAIVGQTAQLVPADKRLYAIRDLTATVDSLPLITASILSKKLSAGLQGLVMDVKTGNGAFSSALDKAEALANSLVSIAGEAGLPTRAWITDMGQVLGATCGNGLEVEESLNLLRGEKCDPRLLEIVRMIAADMLVLGGLALDSADALHKIDRAIATGVALEKFAQMITSLGGPADFVEKSRSYMPAAPFVVDVKADNDGWVGDMLTREIGLYLIELGGGRRHASDIIDARVGLSDVLTIGTKVARGDRLAQVHCATAEQAAEAQNALSRLFTISETVVAQRPVMIRHIEG